MPTVTGPDGVKKEISMEEFLAVFLSEEAKPVSVQRVVTNSETGEEVDRVDIPVENDGSFNPFEGLFGVPSTTEEPAEDMFSFLAKDDTFATFAKIDAAVEYEEELYNQGILPDEPHGDSVLGIFPRIHLKAEAGDEKAQQILKDLP